MSNILFLFHDFQNKKALYALVCESLKYYDVLSELLKKTCLLKLEKSLRNKTELGIVLLYDHLLGRGVTGKFQVKFTAPDKVYICMNE